MCVVLEPAALTPIACRAAQDIDPDTALALVLLHERRIGDKSAWAGFIRGLPPVAVTADGTVLYGAAGVAATAEDRPRKRQRTLDDKKSAKLHTPVVDIGSPATWRCV